MEPADEDARVLGEGQDADDVQVLAGSYPHERAGEGRRGGEVMDLLMASKRVRVGRGARGGRREIGGGGVLARARGRDDAVVILT